MGLLSFIFGKSADLLPLPSGSFTVDCDGRVLASTLPHSYPTAFAQDIATEVLAAFRASQWHARLFPSSSAKHSL